MIAYVANEFATPESGACACVNARLLGLRLFLGACLGAHTVDDETEADGVESVLGTYLVAERVEVGRVELDDAVSLDTDEVAARQAAEAELVVRLLIVEQNLGDDAGFDKVLEGAVDGGLGDAVAGFSHLVKKLIGFEDAFFGEHRIENHRSFGRELQALLADESAED